MDLFIAAVVVIGLAVFMEVKAHKHTKPVKENLQAVRGMKSVAKPFGRHGDHRA